VNSKLQTRLGTLSSWSVWTLTWIIAIRLFVALVSDPNRTENFSPLWLVAWAITTIETLGLIWLVMALGLKRRLKRKPAVAANLILGAVVGAAANVTTGILANAWAIDTEGIWHIRAAGGALSFPLMFILLNNLRGAVIERNANIAKLSEVEDQLLGYRESAKQILQDAYDNMRAKTNGAVLPAIENLNNLLQGQVATGTRLELIDELRNVISDQVRPISKSLSEAAEQLSIPARRALEKPVFNPAWKRRFNLRKSLKLMPAILLIVFGYPMIAFLVIDHRSMLRGLLSAFGVALVMWVLRAFVPKTKEFKTVVGLLLQVLFATIAVVPGFLITWAEYGLTREVIANAIWMAGVSVGSFVLTSYARALDVSRGQFEKELEVFNQQLAKEVALFEQKLWLERRAWSYVLHGDVQGALSAAITRLQRSENLEAYEFEMVKQDLQRAKVALTQPVARELDFSAGIDELVRAWAGVCDIKIEASARATRAIESNRDIRNCINEICKEAISNAVRHGNAKNAWIYLNREKDDVIELEVCNDGHRVLRDQPAGMGLSMIEDLSLNWQLTSERHKDKTCLVAELPISNKN
jgi:signal transduction histidine kinase